MSSALTVSQINTYLKSIIDYDSKLKNIYVCGEISNFTNHYRTGHFYFTLKDERSSIKAVMFKSSAQRIRFEVENGMKVIIRGSISVYERDGIYQLYAEDMMPDGLGALNLAFEQLKQKLSSAGMFDESKKKPLPKYPKRVGVITSETGAAVHDIMTVLERRWPLCEIVLEGVSVQGELAAPQIVEAIENFNRKKAADVLIVGRGGGSIEDLWAFNEESVACAIYESEIPVVSAVGHETDFTIADFVADVRAATPSAAAELVAPDWREVLYSVDKMSESINAVIEGVFGSYSKAVSTAQRLLDALSPETVIDSHLEKTLQSKKALQTAIESKLKNYEHDIESYILKLDSLSPLKIMSKGYCMAADNNEFTITSASKIKEGDNFSLIFSDGRVLCNALSVETNSESQEEEKEERK